MDRVQASMRRKNPVSDRKAEITSLYRVFYCFKA